MTQIANDACVISQSMCIRRLTSSLSAGTRKFNGQTKLYWQGVHVQSFAGHIPFVPNDANADFTIGATNDSGELSSKSTFFDKFQIIDGQCMTAAEVTALYNQGR